VDRPFIVKTSFGPKYFEALLNRETPDPVPSNYVLHSWSFHGDNYTVVFKRTYSGEER
jgi:hypothetical protein